MDLNNITKLINDHPQLSKLDNDNKLILTKDIVYQKVTERLSLFEHCLDQINLTTTHPFLDPTRYMIFNKIFKTKSFPLSTREEDSMKECVRREINLRKKLNKLNF